MEPRAGHYPFSSSPARSWREDQNRAGICASCPLHMHRRILRPQQHNSIRRSPILQLFKSRCASHDRLSMIVSFYASNASLRYCNCTKIRPLPPMGKKRQSKPVHRRAVWDQEDDWALLGLLDFCIKHKDVFPFTEGFVVGRLRSAGSSHDGYTWDQINRRLDHLWRTLGNNDSRNKADIYIEGSACLVGLPENEQSAITSNVERLEKQLKPVCLELFLRTVTRLILRSHQTSLRKNGLGVRVTRKTPSASPFTIQGDQSHTPECDTSDRERLTPRAQRHQIRELAKQWKWTWESPEGCLSEDEAPRKRSRRIKEGVSARQKV